MEEMDEQPGHDAGLEYHARLIADPHRVTAYERALREVVTPGSVVLDVGTGTGILAVMAARLGARRVHAVESMPVGGMATALAQANGVADRVVVHRGDIRDMAPVEPVDLLISEFMGRWVLDDQMLGAMQVAVERWLAPGGRVLPQRVDMYAAPVTMNWFEPLDVWRSPLLGLDLTPLYDRALHHCYGAGLAPPSLLAQPSLYQSLDSRSLSVENTAFDQVLQWDDLRGGVLRGIGGWFDAVLTNNVTLSTVPGVQTHWSQYFFPIDPVVTQAGDRLMARIWLTMQGMWRWAGELQRGREVVLSFDRTQLDPRAFPVPEPMGQTPAIDPEEATRLNSLGAASYEEGDLPAAADYFGRATQALPPGGDAELSAEIFENLGSVCVLLHRYQDAVPALLRALDGDFASREQSARLLVNACFQSGRHLDGARYLEAYEMVYGPHPSGWRGLSSASE